MSTSSFIAHTRSFRSSRPSCASSNAQEVAPASCLPRDRSLNRLARPTLATKSSGRLPSTLSGLRRRPQALGEASARGQGHSVCVHSGKEGIHQRLVSKLGLTDCHKRHFASDQHSAKGCRVDTVLTFRPLASPRNNIPYSVSIAPPILFFRVSDTTFNPWLSMGICRFGQ